MKILNIPIMGLCLLFALTACNSNAGKTSDGQATTVVDTTLVKMDVPVAPEVAAKMDSFLEVYYQLKDALVNGDSTAALKISGVMLNQANMIPLKKITDENRRKQAKEEITGLRSDLSMLQQNASLSAMRSTFASISNAAYRLIKSAGLKNITVYRTYCPMARDGQGAYWLSNSSAIRNPYYGHKMINCGIVKETLQFE